MLQLIIITKRNPLRHRLNALAVARTDQSRHVERAHLSPCFVTQPIHKRLQPTSKLVSPVQCPANHGRPLQKPTTHESQKTDLGILCRSKSAKVVLAGLLRARSHDSTLTRHGFTLQVYVHPPSYAVVYEQASDRPAPTGRGRCALARERSDRPDNRQFLQPGSRARPLGWHRQGHLLP